MHDETTRRLKRDLARIGWSHRDSVDYGVVSSLVTAAFRKAGLQAPNPDVLSPVGSARTLALACRVVGGDMGAPVSGRLPGKTQCVKRIRDLGGDRGLRLAVASLLFRVGVGLSAKDLGL